MSAGIRTIGVRIDIETKSREDIKAGAYRYVEDPDFEVQLIAYSLLRRHPGGAVRLTPIKHLDLSDPVAVAKFQALLANPSFQKHAFNANFERIGLSRWAGMPNGTYYDPVNWRCTAINANVNGVFGTLDEVARAVRAPVKKDSEGKALIRFFAQPQKDGSFNHPSEHPERFAKYGEYNIQDVLVEAAVAREFPEIPDDVQAQYEADQRINDRGVRHFAGLSRAAVAQVKTEQARLMDELKDMTGLDNPNSVTQFRGWLESQGYPMTSLDKTHRGYALADPMCPPHVAQALELKGAASLSSVTKHNAALKSRSKFDGRIRGSLRFYGAHTGREAGRGIQPQNLPRYEAPAADRHRLLRGQAGADAPLIAKGTVRASLVPAKDHVFVVPDYNAIEARCLGWQCGEKWVEAEFRGEGKIYEATASTMFGVDKAVLVAGLKACDKCGKDSCQWCAYRNKGKVSNLALGYAGGAGALVTMGAEEAGIDIGNYKELNALWKSLGAPGKFHEWEKDQHHYPELIRLRDLYRNASPETVRFWKLCGKAWDLAALTGKGARFGQDGCVTIMRDGKHNRLVLPSGRSIWYRFARSHADPSNPDRIDRRTFMGKSMGVGHVRTDTHGGKLTENITQAVARDVLFDLIMKIEAMTAQGWPGRIVLHVHDEVVIEVHKKHAQQVLDDTLGLMAVPPDWAPGLVVKGAGGIMERYGK